MNYGSKKNPKNRKSHQDAYDLAWRSTPRITKKRAKKAVAILKSELKKHTRKKLEHIRVSNQINEEIWKHSTFNIPPKITVDVLIEKETARAFLAKTKEMSAFLKIKEDREKAKKKEEAKAKEEEKAKTAEEKKEEKEKEAEKEQKLLEKKAKEGSAKMTDLKQNETHAYE